MRSIGRRWSGTVVQWRMARGGKEGTNIPFRSQTAPRGISGSSSRSRGEKMLPAKATSSGEGESVDTAQVWGPKQRGSQSSISKATS